MTQAQELAIEELFAVASDQCRGLLRCRSFEQIENRTFQTVLALVPAKDCCHLG